MDELIKYFQEKLKLTSADLLLDNDDRMILVGQLDMLEQMLEIQEIGYPNAEEETE